MKQSKEDRMNLLNLIDSSKVYELDSNISLFVFGGEDEHDIREFEKNVVLLKSRYKYEVYGPEGLVVEPLADVVGILKDGGNTIGYAMIFLNERAVYHGIDAIFGTNKTSDGVILLIDNQLICNDLINSELKSKCQVVDNELEDDFIAGLRVIRYNNEKYMMAYTFSVGTFRKMNNSGTYLYKI